MTASIYICILCQKWVVKSCSPTWRRSGYSLCGEARGEARTTTWSGGTCRTPRPPGRTSSTSRTTTRMLSRKFKQEEGVKRLNFTVIPSLYTLENYMILYFTVIPILSNNINNTWNNIWYLIWPSIRKYILWKNMNILNLTVIPSIYTSEKYKYT